MARAVATDYHEKKAQILAHASALFAAEGFSRVSMTQLADACDISKSNLYHYYRDKESILFHLLDEHMDEIIHILRQDVLDAAEDGQQLHMMIQSLLLNYQQADSKHRLLLNDIQVLPDDKQTLIREKERLIVQYFKNAILLHNPVYASNPKLLSAAAMTLLGSINWAFTWFKPNKGLTVTELANFIANIYERGFQIDPFARESTHEE